MDLTDLLASFGALKVIDPLLAEQYRVEEEAIYAGDLEASARESGWHSAFHASSFPGDNQMSCARKALYGLMAIPDGGPFSRDSRAYMEMGLDVETRLVQRLDRAGVLLSGADPDQQFGFSSRKHWLEGRVDAVVRIGDDPGKPHVGEIKTTSAAKAAEMRAGKRSYEWQHKAQAMTYTWFVRHLQQKGIRWKDMDLCDSASILYVSRDRPGEVIEYLIQYDEDFMQEGFAKLKEWREAFIADQLPPRDPTWKWSLPPCQWCAYKKGCKEDVKNKVTRLTNSSCIDLAKQVKAHYDPMVIREAVMERWT